MEGVITQFTNSSMTVNVDYTVGSGNYSSWNIVLAGESGLGYSGFTGGGIPLEINSTVIGSQNIFTNYEPAGNFIYSRG